MEPGPNKYLVTSHISCLHKQAAHAPSLGASMLFSVVVLCGEELRIKHKGFETAAVRSVDKHISETNENRAIHREDEALHPLSVAC